MKKDVVPAYSNVDSFINTAAECNAGTEHRDKTALKMTASRSEHVLLWHKGKSIPLKNAAGLKVAFLSAMKSAKCNLRLSAMSWRTRGRSTKLKKRWAIVYPNYEYGQSATAAFKKLMKEKQPDVEFVIEQAPPLGKIEAGAVADAIAAAKPDAIFSSLFGPDLAKFVREGNTRGLFKGVEVFNLLAGEPEYLDPLKDETPEGWYVTGYPWEQIDTPEHKKFREAYMKKFNDYPRLGSIVGYATVQSAAAVIKKAGTLDTEKLVAAMSGLTHSTPLGNITYRPQDHQSTMGAYVGKTTLKNGKGTMKDWHYADGAKFLPSDSEVAKLRPVD